MKRLIVDKPIYFCAACYWYQEFCEGDGKGDFCFHPIWLESGDDSKVIEDVTTIPVFCPLETI